MSNRLSLCLAVVLLGAVALRGTETVDDALKRAALDYGQRLGAANDELTQTRERIAREKAPLLKARRAAEDRIAAAEAQITRLETDAEHFQEDHRKLGKDADALRKNASYLATLAHDSLVALEEGLQPGERQFLPARFQTLQEEFNNPAKPAGTQSVWEAADLLLARVQQALGGYTVAGSSLIDGDNRMADGTYAFVGPETFFRAAQGGVAGTVRVREGTGHPVTYPLTDWSPADAEAFFQGRMGVFLADASAGKALRLKETKGTVWQHINKGGVVSYAILAVGLASVLLILRKVRDLLLMAVNPAETIRHCLGVVATGTAAQAEQTVRELNLTTRELFTVGLQNIAEPREVLEEQLTAVLLRQRLHYEHWLPLLAVIATAAPLMGLLGTVTGMVRTFALITVFGTGNAGKLASGISEVLVATELGLLVAIPTLVAHGFLSQRIQRNLALLERYALEFVTAVEKRKTREQSKETIAV
jgi:biopolymer transport protein ExbB